MWEKLLFPAGGKIKHRSCHDSGTFISQDGLLAFVPCSGISTEAQNVMVKLS